MVPARRAAADAIRALTVRIDELAAAHAAADPLGPGGRRELFDELADLVDAARSVEERAVELLRP